MNQKLWILVLAVFILIVAFLLFLPDSEKKSKPEDKVKTKEKRKQEPKIEQGTLIIEVEKDNFDVDSVTLKLRSFAQPTDWEYFAPRVNEKTAITLTVGEYDAVAEIKGFSKEHIRFEILTDKEFLWKIKFRKPTSLAVKLFSKTEPNIRDAQVQALFLGDNSTVSINKPGNENENYTTRNISPGVYLLRVFSSRYLPGIERIQIQSNKENFFQLELRKGKTLEIFLKDDLGHPVNTKVELTLRKILDNMPPVKMSTRNSKATFENFAAGEYLITAEAEGFIPCHMRIIFAVGETSKKIAMTLFSGISIYGFVYDKQGMPAVKNAFLILNESSNIKENADNSGIDKTRFFAYRTLYAKSDESGKFKFPPSSRRFELVVKHRKYQTETLDFTKAEPRLPIQIFLNPLAVGKITVLTEGRKPIPKAQIHIIFNNLANFLAVTSESGEADIPLKAKGLLDLRVTAKGFQSKNKTIADSELEKGVEIILLKDAVLELKILDEKSKPVDCEYVKTEEHAHHDA